MDFSQDIIRVPLIAKIEELKISSKTYEIDPWLCLRSNPSAKNFADQASIVDGKLLLTSFSFESSNFENGDLAGDQIDFDNVCSIIGRSFVMIKEPISSDNKMYFADIYSFIQTNSIQSAVGYIDLITNTTTKIS